MNCQRCDSIWGDATMYRVRTDLLDLRVCGQCAKAAEELSLLVESLSGAATPDQRKHSCRDEVELIADYLAGSLAPRAAAVFEEHLGKCRDCTAFLNTYKETIQAVKLLGNRSRDISSTPFRLAGKRPATFLKLI